MKKLCPRCNRRLVSISKKYCEVCETKTNKRHKEYKRYRSDVREQYFYSTKEWTCKRNKVKYLDNGLCLLCLSENRHKAMGVVHHIVELKEDWNKRLDEDNLISLCESCHQIVHKEYRKINQKELKEKLKKIIRISRCK